MSKQANEELLKVLTDKIHHGESLVMQLEPIKEIDGIMKLQRKIRQEIEFLLRLQKTGKVKIEQLCCSNLRHLEAMVESCTRPGVVAVCKMFHINEDSKLVIDVISDEGRTWSKVIAKNPKSLSALSAGNSSYGARSIIDQAKDYLECAKLYPCMYQPPRIIFEFVSGIEETLANRLKSLGIIIKGDVLPDSKTNYICDDSSYSSQSSNEEEELHENSQQSYQEVTQCIAEHPEIDTLNLDVTAMMAYVSNMTNV